MPIVLSAICTQSCVYQSQRGTMSKLNLEIFPPSTADVNSVFSEIERKYRWKAATPETVADMEREAARLIRRLITTKVTFVK